MPLLFALIISVLTFSPIVSAQTLSNSSSCPNLTRTLQKGSRGTDVTQLQSLLIQKGYLSSDSATGYFGTMTEAAVKQFQCAQSVVCSGNPSSTGYGLVGAKTRAAIQKVCSGTTTQNPSTQTQTITQNTTTSLVDQLTAQIKQLQERIAALTTGTATSQSTTCSSRTETRSSSCQSGQTGSVTKQRTSTCVNGGEQWGEWQTTASTCSATQASTATATSNIPNQTFGTIDSSSSDFTATLSSSAILIGNTSSNQLNNIRPWIGYSNCTTCTDNNLSQTITFENPGPNQNVTITVTPWYSSSAQTFYATASGASIASGASKTFSPGNQSQSNDWVITFNTTETSKTITITLSNNLNSGVNYLYLDAIKISVAATSSTQSCTFNSQTVAHGSSVTAYQSSSVASGQTCQSQTRTCSNGTLSGTYAAAACSVAAATSNASCTFNSQTVAHGASVTAYQSSSVASGQTCQSQTRTCSNGTLSGSYTAASCSVAAATSYASCTLNGETIAHGASKVFYWRSSADSSATCAAAAQTRTCSNGTLSGTPGYGYSSCTVTTSSKKCRPPRHYSYTLPADTVLPCTPSTTDIFSVTIPDTGNAVARTELTYKNNSSSDIYFWGTYVVPGSYKITYGQGDDLCPGYSAKKVSLGYGTLSSGSQVVRIMGQSGAGSCTNGSVTALAGGTLDVWVEDPDPVCQGKDVGMVSSYDVYGLSYQWLWNNSMQKIVELLVPESSDRTSIKILSAIEGTPNRSPNRVCGAESATMAAQVTSSLTGIVDTKVDVVPVSLGMGHLVLAPEGTITTAMNSALNSSHTLQLLAGSNFNNGYSVFTGGCCGDGKLGFVRLGGESSGVTMTAAQPTVSSGGSTIVSWSAPGTSSCALYFNGVYSYTFSTLTANASSFATGPLTSSTSYELRCTAGSTTVIGSVLVTVQ